MEGFEREVRGFVAEHLRAAASRLGFDGDLELADDTSLVAGGILDSLGFVELLAEAESRFGVEIDLEEHDPAAVTTLGGFVRVVAASRGV